MSRDGQFWVSANSPDHSTTLQAQGEMAVVYSRVGRVDESLTLLNDAVTRLRKSMGKDHLLTLMTEASVAGALMLKGDLGRAEALQTKTRATVAKQVGVDHPVTQAMSFQLAHIQLLQSKTAEARMSLAGTQADIIKQVDPSTDWAARIELLRGCIESQEGDRTARQRIEGALSNLNMKSAESRTLGNLAKRTLLDT